MRLVYNIYISVHINVEYICIYINIMRLTRLHGHVQTEGRQLRTLIGHLSGIDTLATAVVW